MMEQSRTILCPGSPRIFEYKNPREDNVQAFINQKTSIQFMYNNIFSQAGLTQTQAEILEFLLKNGSNKAISISKELKKPRGVVYKSLDELLKLSLVEKIEKSRKIAVFRAAHPSNIEKLFEEKEQKQRSKQTQLKTN